VELEHKGGSVGRGKLEMFDMTERLDLEGSDRRSYLELISEGEGSLG